METRELPVLSTEDQGLVDRLAVGLSDEAARALAYLILRDEHDEFGDAPASLPEIRLGTALNRSAAIRALETLVDRALAEQTSLRTGEQGRPPAAWSPNGTREAAFGRVRLEHARALLERTRPHLRRPSDDPSLDALDVSDVPDVPVEREGVPAADRRPRLALNWRPNGLHAPVFAARADGSFAEHGLSVAVEAGDGSRDALQSLQAGSADFGIAGAATVVRARASGAPVVPVALLYQRALTVLYTVRERFGEPLTSLSQVSGRRVGMPVESEVGVLGQLFLAQGGVLEDVELVELAGEEHVSLRSGDVDVVTGSFADPWRLEADGFDVDVLPVAEQFPIYGPALVVHEERVVDGPELVRDGLRAMLAGWDSARRRPADAARAVCEAGGESVDGERVEHERRVFEHAVREFGGSEAVREHGWGWHRTDGWERLETALGQVGLVSAA